MDLTGQLLLATPAMTDPRFSQSVILLCSHGAGGAMGLILNKPVEDLKLPELIRHTDAGPIGDPSRVPNWPVYFGGPVETQRGFVLHDTSWQGQGTADVNEDFALSASPEILAAICAGHGPATARVMLGYAGWSAGQLESELQTNSWLTLAASLNLVFGTPAADQWHRALHSLGINPASFSAIAGHA